MFLHKSRNVHLSRLLAAGMTVLVLFSLLAVSALAAGSSSQGDISQEQAEQIALEQAGLTAEDVSRLRTVQDWDDGFLEYEVEFFTDETEYDYTIDAETGTIWEESQEIWQRGNQADGDIGTDAARDAALAHAELKEEDTQNLRAHADLDDGYFEYEVQWFTDTYEFEYVVDGVTGAIWQWSKTMLPAARVAAASGSTAAPAAGENGDIGAEAARDIALEKAGLTLDQVTQMHVEWETCDDYFDHHHDSLLNFQHDVYEISFRHGREEYDCMVDCTTGEVLEFEHEYDD